MSGSDKLILRKEEDKDCQKTIRRRPEMLMMNSITASGCCDGQSKSDLEKLIYLGESSFRMLVQLMEPSAKVHCAVLVVPQFFRCYKALTILYNYAFTHLIDGFIFVVETSD